VSVRVCACVYVCVCVHMCVRTMAKEAAESSSNGSLVCAYIQSVSVQKHRMIYVRNM